MKHLTDEQIVRLVAGEWPAAQADEARRHVDACPECAERVGRQKGLWTLLEAWQPPQATCDVTAGVLGRLDREAGAPVRPVLVRLSWAQIGRIAAGVLIGVGVGHGIGRRVGGSFVSQEPAQATATAADAIESMGLHVFAASSVGLADVIDPADEAGDGQEEPL